MADDNILTEDELQDALRELAGWELRDGWLRRTFATPGWPHTMLLTAAIGYVAEAAWHHPDLSIGWLCQGHRQAENASRSRRDRKRYRAGAPDRQGRLLATARGITAGRLSKTLGPLTLGANGLETTLFL